MEKEKVSIKETKEYKKLVEDISDLIRKSGLYSKKLKRKENK